jgi:Holliday junction resolvase-like predicted endonuclease
MVLSHAINRSRKREGVHEHKIIQALTGYFQDMGYSVVPHAQLNIAWGPIISELDMLLLREDTIIYVEVKSHKDNLTKAVKQIERVKDFIDYGYVATSQQANNWNSPNIGLIRIDPEHIDIIKKAKRFTNSPRYSTIASLKKTCLIRLLGNDQGTQRHIRKRGLARRLFSQQNSGCTREHLKQIITCANKCPENCPVSKLID